MKRPILVLTLAALALGGCATGGGLSALGALSAAGYSIDAYCTLTPEGRAAIRARLGIDAQLIACPNDPAEGG